jgi:purine-binding chemotaxis protein CheW
MNNMRTGLIVDCVSEVLQFSDDQIDPTPAMSSEVQVEFIAGIGKREDNVYILLDLERLLAKKEAEELKEIPDQVEAGKE